MIWGIVYSVIGKGKILIICSCAMISKVWKSIMKWLDFMFISLPNLFIHVECCSSEGSNEKLRKRFWLI